MRLVSQLALSVALASTPALAQMAPVDAGMDADAGTAASTNAATDAGIATVGLSIGKFEAHKVRSAPKSSWVRVTNGATVSRNCAVLTGPVCHAIDLLYSVV